MEIVKRREKFERDPFGFRSEWEPEQEELRARIGRAEAQIRIDDANGRQAWEVMPLGYHLRADHNVDGARLYAADDLAHLNEGGHQIGGEQGYAGLGKAFADLLGNPFHARSAGHQRVRGTTLGTFLRDRQREPAMVTVEAVPITVFDQPGSALRAIQPVATAAAKRKRSIAAAIEKKQALLALRQGLRHGVHEGGG